MALDQRHRYIISKVMHHAAVLCSTDAEQSYLLAGSPCKFTG
jgi:hypothetical protein